MYNFALGFITFLTIVLVEIIFHQLSGSPLEVPAKNYVGLFIFTLACSFIKNQSSRFIFLNLLLILSFFQMIHLQFYSIPVYPNAIYLFFTQQGEIIDTLKENLYLFILPLSLIIPALGINFYVNRKFALNLKSVPYLQFLFIGYLLFNPLRTYFTGNTWGRQPSGQEFMGTNIYLSMSYFAGKILPFKVLEKSHTPGPYPNVKLSKVASFDGDIILILGESLSANHLSLFGYPRNTTPYLSSIKDDSDFYAYQGISSAVSTDVAVALFFNMTYGLNALNDISKGKNCLFRLAKLSGFQTAYYSSQSSEQLRYTLNSMCPNQIDNFKSIEDIEPSLDDWNKANDHKLVEFIQLSNPKEENKFIVLHQRGSHSPYNLRYKDNKLNFKLTDDYSKDRVNHYDNTVLDFDFFMKKLLKRVKSNSKPTIVIYLSDHGEGLGEEGVWGHAALKGPSFKIPILIYTHMFKSNDLPFMVRPLTQFNLSLFIAKLLGHKSQYDLNTFPPEYKILGNDLDGFAGFLEVKKKKDSIFFEKHDL